MRKDERERKTFLTHSKARRLCIHHAGKFRAKRCLAQANTWPRRQDVIKKKSRYAPVNSQFVFPICLHTLPHTHARLCTYINSQLDPLSASSFFSLLLCGRCAKVLILKLLSGREEYKKSFLLDASLVSTIWECPLRSSIFLQRGNK
jgi:hypothetical protein